jgi:hypothetical protein
MARNKIDLTKNVQRIAAKQPPKDDRSPTIDYPISTRAADTVLPAEAGVLSERLQEIARQYIGARQRSGEALLEAARWLSEARAEAQHGEWYIFLNATGTSEDAADTMLNLHNRAMTDGRFAEAVRTNWLGQSAAGLLARRSTPPEVIKEVLSAPEPPKVEDIRRKIKVAKAAPAVNAPAQIPEFPGFEQPGLSAVIDPESSSVLDLLSEVADTMAHLENSAHELPAGAETERILVHIERSVAVIRRIIQRRAD